MRQIMWIVTMSFALTGLALHADRGFWPGDSYASLGAPLVRGLFLLALLACPLLWARGYGIVPRALRISGGKRFLMALALLLATPLILPWS